VQAQHCKTKMGIGDSMTSKLQHHPCSKPDADALSSSVGGHDRRSMLLLLLLWLVLCGCCCCCCAPLTWWP
jgi:hypothetical protein